VQNNYIFCSLRQYNVSAIEKHQLTNTNNC